MNLWMLKPGHKIRTHDGAEASMVVVYFLLARGEQIVFLEEE